VVTQQTPQVASLLYYSPGSSVLFQSSPNREYTLEFTTNLSSGAWNSISSQTTIRGSGGMDALTNPSPTGPQGHYRIQSGAAAFTNLFHRLKANR
jgi:hypothetical protein